MNIDPNEYAAKVQQLEDMARQLGRMQAHADQQQAHIREQGASMERMGKLADEAVAIVNRQGASMDRLQAVGEEQARLLRALQAVMGAAVQLRGHIMCSPSCTPVVRDLVAKLDAAIDRVGAA